MLNKKFIVRFLGIWISFFLIVFMMLLIFDDNSIKVTQYEYESKKINDAFDGYRILQISDLHNHKAKYSNGNMLEIIEKLEFDLVLFTGDIIDEKTVDLSILENILKCLKGKPGYYVNGNHEYHVSDKLYQEMIILLKNYNVKDLNDKHEVINEYEGSFNLYGISDPQFSGVKYLLDVNEGNTSETLEEFNINKDELNILVSHRPELFKWYKDFSIDLAFTGHTHAGQFRFPIIGAVFSPNQLLFPKYSYGKYCSENTTMIVSSGLGESTFSLRLNTTAELVLLTLKGNID